MGKKVFKTFVMTILMVYSLVLMPSMSVKAIDKIGTEDEAIQWLQERLGTKVGTNGTCMNLVNHYIIACGGQGGYLNGPEMITGQRLPGNGWQYIEGENEPKKGDILIFKSTPTSANGDDGHVAIYENSGAVWHQNILGYPKVVIKIVNQNSSESGDYIAKNYTNGNWKTWDKKNLIYWGVLRPPFAPPCNHQYNNRGICELCNTEFPPYGPVELNIQMTARMQDAAMHDAPYGEATTIGRLQRGQDYTVVRQVYNYYNNLWYLVRDTDGVEKWVVSDYLQRSEAQQVAVTDKYSITVSNNVGRHSIAMTNATLYGTVSYSGRRPSEVGLYLGTSPDNLSRVARDSINFSKNPFDVYYDLNKNANWTLTPGETYYYCFYAAVDGVEVVNSPVESFTTQNDHTCNYDNEGYCTICHKEFPLTQVRILKGLMIAKKGGSAIHSRPYGDAPITSRTKAFIAYPVIKSARNSFGNLWYQIASGEWINCDYLDGNPTVLSEPSTISKAIEAPQDHSKEVTVTTSSSISLQVVGETNVTETNATVKGKCSYSGSKPTEVGLLFGQSSGNLKKVASDRINHNKNPFDIWYDLNSEAHITLTAETAYYYQFYAVVGGNTVYSDEVGFVSAGNGGTNTKPSPMPTQNSSINVNATGASNVTQTDARVNGNCSYSGSKPSEVGLLLGTDRGNLPKVASDRINHNKNPFDIWYDINAETGITLNPGTTYYYQLYAVTNSGTTYSDVSSFTTNNREPAPVKQEQPQSSVSINGTGATNVTQTNATVNGTCSYSGSRPSEVGLLLGTDSNNLNKVASDRINHNKNPFDIWYDINAEAYMTLNAGTTYYYQLYAIVNGATTYSGVYSFTTSAPAAPQVNTYGVNINATQATDISSRNAVVRGTCGYSGSRPSEVGLYIGTDPGNMSWAASDRINHWKNPFDIWYDLNAEAGYTLSSGVTYYYQLYAIVDGNFVTSNVASFTAY